MSEKMEERLVKRLEELKQEYDSGLKMINNLDAQRAELQQKMLRISGAIQVLEEELAAAKTQETAS